MSDLINVTIDGINVQVPKGTLLVEAAKTIQHEIPVYCYHPKLKPAGLCRMCLVEIEKMPKLQIACNTVATDGMVVHTRSPQVTDARRSVLEFLLVNHPLDCPICDKGGECDLQDFAMAYGPGASRTADPKTRKPKAVDLGPTIVLDKERCILCYRCVRFDDEITQERSLVQVERGNGAMIATASDRPYESNFSGNVTELCPVGALTSKTYRFKSRPWDLHRTKTTCTQCSVGCQQFVDERHTNILRTMSNPHDDDVSEGWLCDRGRYNVGFVNDERRITTPLYKHQGQWVQVPWDDAIALWAKALRDAGPAASGFIGGGRLLNEEAYLLQHFARQFGSDNIDWRAGRQRQATSNAGGSVADLETAQAIVVVGDSPAESAPILDLRIIKAVHHFGAKLIRVGSTDHATPVPQMVLAGVEEAMANIGAAERIALVWDGTDAALGRTLGAAAQALRAAGKTVFTYIPGEAANARGAEAMGLHPAFGPGYRKLERAGLDSAAMLSAAAEGQLKALAIFGANPVLHFGDRELLEKALTRVPFLALSELFMTQTAEFATLILPAKAAYEKSGTTTNLAGSILNLSESIIGPGETRSDCEIIALLAEALGVDVPSVDAIRETVESLAASCGDVPLGDAAWCGAGSLPRGAGAKQRLRIVVAPHIFAGGGSSAHDISAAALRPKPAVSISPRDAAQLGVSDGAFVDLCGYRGTLRDLTVRIGRHVLDGEAVVIEGLPEAPAGALLGDLVEIARIRNAGRELVGGGVGE